eukprot:scaffold87655_cov35-Tisochrysis_lutea.AAC.5
MIGSSHGATEDDMPHLRTNVTILRLRCVVDSSSTGDIRCLCHSSWLSKTARKEQPCIKENSIPTNTV